MTVKQAFDSSGVKGVDLVNIFLNILLGLITMAPLWKKV